MMGSRAQGRDQAFPVYLGRNLLNHQSKLLSEELPTSSFLKVRSIFLLGKKLATVHTGVVIRHPVGPSNNLQEIVPLLLPLDGRS